MSDKSYFNELQRALARPDIDNLREQLGTFYRHTGSNWPDEVDSDMDAVMCAHWPDPDRGLAYLALAMAEYDDPEFLGVMAAGLLENLLQDPTAEFLERIATEARKTERFRWMLGIPFRHAMPDRVWEKIEDYVIKDVDGTPLPPRPFA